MEVELAALQVYMPSELFFNLVNRVATIEARQNLRVKGREARGHRGRACGFIVKGREVRGHKGGAYSFTSIYTL